MKPLLSCLVLGFFALVAYGCDAAIQSAQLTPTSPLPSASATAAVAAPTAPPTWVPPTALVGTPIPGAEATLTAAPRLKTGILTITNSKGEQTAMTVEIADTPESRQLGLMFRSSLPPNGGMLFQFEEETNSGFWMQNTILPLSIAWIEANGRIVDIKDMQPLDTTVVGPQGFYRYALETNQGFFRAHGIAPGDQVTLPGSQSAVIPGMPSCSHED